MAIYVDANVFVHLIIESELTENAKKIFYLAEDFLTSPAALEEAIYIGIRLIAAERLGIYRPHELRRYVARHGINFARDYIGELRAFLQEAGIEVVADNTSLEDIISIMRSYNLLPNDALIAATCRKRGIKIIATFNDDFRRVDFLIVIP